VTERSSSDQPIRITRDALRDGSLSALVRARMPPGMTILSEGEIAADLERTLSRYPPGEDLWLFGYGSLMWNPAIHFAEKKAGEVRGWHRRFCLWLHGGRGSPESPGLMLGLERGGRCAGIVYRIPAAKARSELLLAWRRELFTRAYHSRWVSVQTADGPVAAVTFVVNRTHSHYAGRLDDAAVAAHLASATGALGSCAEYLAATLDALHSLGLRDRSLERLQHLIANQRQ
jgi:cation transport protein ChaC